MKTMFTRSWGGETLWSLSTAQTCPTISPAVRLRFTPSKAVRQNWQSTAQPTWLEMQMVERPAVIDLPPCFELLACFERRLPAAPKAVSKLIAALAAAALGTEPSASSPASLPSPASPPSPSGIHTVSTLWPSPNRIKYLTVPSID